MMRQMLLTRSIGSYIHIQPPGGAEDRRYDKTNAAPVVIIPAYGNFDGNIYYFWAVIGWSKEDVAGNVSTPQYTSNYTVAVGERTVYILTLDRGAYRPQDAYIAYRNAEGNVQVTLWPPTQDTCYDLTPSTITETNAVIQEAVRLLETVRYEGIAPRIPSNGKLIIKNLGQISCLDAPGTIDVKASLIDVYKKLTSANFFVEPYQSVINVNNPSASNMWVWTFSKSYDPNTGILTIPMMAQNVVPGRLGAGLQSVTVYAVYVK